MHLLLVSEVLSETTWTVELQQLPRMRVMLSPTAPGANGAVHTMWSLSGLLPGLKPRIWVLPVAGQMLLAAMIR